MTALVVVVAIATLAPTNSGGAILNQYEMAYCGHPPYVTDKEFHLGEMAALSRVVIEAGLTEQAQARCKGKK